MKILWLFVTQLKLTDTSERRTVAGCAGSCIHSPHLQISRGLSETLLILVSPSKAAGSLLSSVTVLSTTELSI